MKTSEDQSPVSFDAYAGNYDESLNRALAITGEDKNYYAAARIQRLGQIFFSVGYPVKSILDFGCGTGTGAEYLRDVFGPSKVTGVDPSGESIRVARETYPSADFSFLESNKYAPAGDFDAAYCNGVFHHIPNPERLDAAKCVFNSLVPGGMFALWENNPWNPGTVYVMSRCEFDRDAVTLSPPESRRLLQQAGFKILRTEYLFFFPKFLSFFRPLEEHLKAVPLGAQYLVLGRKPWVA